MVLRFLKRTPTKAAPTSGPAITLDVSSPAFTADPYPIYHALRRDDPVHKAAAGYWFVSRYADVKMALRDERLSNSPAPFALVHPRNRHKYLAADVTSRLFAFMDPPDHGALRGPVAKALRLGTRDAPLHSSAAAQATVSRLPKNGGIDLIRNVAEPFTVEATCRIYGLPHTLGQDLLAWAYDFFALFHAIPDRSTLSRLEASVTAFKAEITRALSAPDLPPGTVLHALSQALGDTLTREEAVDNAMLLIADSIGNVQAGIVNTLSVLVDRDAFALWDSADPAVCGRLVDECLRLESPGQYQGRIALEPVTIGGRDIPRHSVILLGFAAANRDPAVFDDPDAFDPDRAGPPHLAFGAGRHLCLGQSLARDQIICIVSQLLERFGALAPSGTRPVWQARPGHRWMSQYTLLAGAGHGTVGK
ncbi:MAG: cytochrome P450 [Shimia sp.]